MKQALAKPPGVNAVATVSKFPEADTLSRKFTRITYRKPRSRRDSRRIDKTINLVRDDTLNHIHVRHFLHSVIDAASLQVHDIMGIKIFFLCEIRNLTCCFSSLLSLLQNSLDTAVK